MRGVGDVRTCEAPGRRSRASVRIFWRAYVNGVLLVALLVLVACRVWALVARAARP